MRRVILESKFISVSLYIYLMKITLEESLRLFCSPEKLNVEVNMD